MIAVEIDADEQTEAQLALVIEHMLDTLTAHSYSVTVQGA